MKTMDRKEFKRKNIRKLVRNAKYLEKDNICERAVKYILTSPEKELAGLKIAAAAEAIGTKPGRLCESFRQEMNTTFEKYVSFDIVLRALNYLESGMEIGTDELAQKFGFLKVEDFAGLFESYFLVKPGEYKELVKNRSRENIDLALKEEYLLLNSLEILRN